MTGSPALPAAFRALLEAPAFGAWLEQHGLAGADLDGAVLLAGGTQNILVRFSCREGEMVLRHPPLHKRRESDETLRREVRTLQLLDAHAVPHPRLRAASVDAQQFGSVLYVMEHVDGFAPAHSLPPAYGERPAWQHRIGLAMIEGLVALAAVPVQAALDAGFRDQQAWLPRQPQRWLAHLEGLGESALLPAGRQICQWLVARTPGQWERGLIHGDYHLGNVLMATDSPRLAAILDWELATLGCPALDLAHFLVGWPVGNPSSPFADLEVQHFSSAHDLLAHYEHLRGQAVADLNWYGVLACFRLGALLEGTYARARAGQADAETGRRLHGIAVHMFEQAAGFMDGAGLHELQRRR